MPRQIDSLMHFDSIIAIYTQIDSPPIITDDATEKGETRSTLYIDSINRWTKSKKVIDSVYNLFPNASKFHGVIEFVCCGHRELFIQTTRKKFRISWNMNTSDSAVFVDTIPYRMDKNALNKIFKCLDRKIITKEILLKDSVLYMMGDIYNKEYSRSFPETRLVYILK